MDHSKRNLFKGRITQKNNLVPLPWTNTLLTERCTRCNQCIQHCEEHILIRGDGGFPSIDFKRGECTFCGACAQHCDANVFNTRQNPVWTLTATINEHCLAKNAIVCRTCEDQCEQQAIQFKLHLGGRSTPVVSPEDCNGCGACYAPCPTQSIQIKEAA